MLDIRPWVLILLLHENITPRTKTLIILWKVIFTFLFVVHCGSIRQTASILSMSRECLRTGDKAVVHFRFIKNPEYLNLNQRLVFREGRTKAVGNVSKVIPMVPTLAGGHGAKGKVIKNAPKMLVHNLQTNENAIPSANGAGLPPVDRKEESPDPVTLPKRNSLDDEAVSTSQQNLQSTSQQGGVGQGQKRNGKRGGRRKHANSTSSGGGPSGPLAESNI